MIAYKDIKNIVANREVDRSQGTVKCLFRCPVTHFEVDSTASIHEGHGLVDTVIDEAARNFGWQFRNYVYQALANRCGNSFLGRVLRDTAQGVLYKQRVDEVFTEGEINAATAQAFEYVSHNFHKTEDGWVCKKVADEFAPAFVERLRSYPVKEKYESTITARLLTHLAALGARKRAEQDFLWKFTPQNSDSSETKPMPSTVELMEVNPALRETILSLCWALVQVDGELCDEEFQAMRQVSQGLSVSSERALELRDEAADFIITEALKQGSEKESGALAQSLQLSPERYERLKVRLHKSR